jgi:hypothetical protein
MRSKSAQSNPSIDPAIVKWEAQNRESLQQDLRNFTDEFRVKEASFINANTKSAESVLALCKVVADAWGKFVQLDAYIKKFRKETKLTNKSTFSQHRTIGLNYERLVGLVQHLPSSWYAIYQIARLNDDTLNQAIATGKIHPRMKQREVAALLGRSDGQKTAVHLSAGRKSIFEGRPFLQIEFPSTAPLVAAEVEAFQAALTAFVRTQPAPFNQMVQIAWSQALKDAVNPTAPRKRQSATTPVQAAASEAPSEWNGELLEALLNAA